jgi:TRAP-type C4-dicarboxylate transport system substrate-binding protein
MFNRRLFAAAALAALATGWPLSAAAQTTILFNSFIPPQHPVNTRIFKPWAEEIAKVTEGRVKVDIAPASLAAPPQQLDGVSKGVFDMAYQFHGFLAPRIKLTQMAMLPGVNTTAKGSSIALWRTYEKYFKSADEFKDVQLLGLFAFQPATIFGMKSPIASVADLKGTKVFAVPGAPATLMEGAGAGVVAAPAVRSYEIISGGTVDAFAGYTVNDAVAFKTMQYAKHVTDVPGGLTATAFALFINKKKWESISAADREAIARVAGEGLALRMSELDALEAKLRADAAASGVQIKPASDAFVADLRRLAEPIEKAWLADAKSLGVNGEAALAYYKQQAAENAR